MHKVIHGDCLEVMRGLEADSFDAIVTDPPAGISFMGKAWDTFPCGNRGVCRKTGDGKPCAAHGFARDVHWEYTPKARAGFVAFLTRALAECYRVAKPGAYALVWAIPRTSHWTATAIEDAGWQIVDRVAHIFGSGFPKHRSKLKPAVEDWWLAWKPARYATPLQIDACRIGQTKQTPGGISTRPRGTLNADAWGYRQQTGEESGHNPAIGRWPANLVLDAQAARLLDEQAGERCGTHGGGVNRQSRARRSGFGLTAGVCVRDAGGDPSRFFYCSKASRKDRGAGNTHPTVKPHELCRRLCRLVTPPGGHVLDPFAGSGSTGLAALAEGLRFTGVEQSAEYVKIARRRLATAATPNTKAA